LSAQIQEMLMSNGRCLKDYPSFTQLYISDSHTIHNRFIFDKLQYNKEEMTKEHAILIKSLIDEHMHVYEDIMTAVLSQKGWFFFLMVMVGQKKLLCERHCQLFMIVLNVTSSGTVSLLLLDGKILHSTFCISLLINDESTCNIAQSSLRTKLLMATNLIIWDEAPMMNKMCFEAFDWTLRDIMKNVNDANAKPLGGKVVVLGGDFRQILPIIKKGSTYDIIKSSIHDSQLWKCCQVLKLSKNMRLSTTKDTQTTNDTKEFVDWILEIGDGDMDLNENGECIVEIPEDLLIANTELPLLSLVNLCILNF